MGHLLDGDFEKMLGRRKRNALLDGIAQGLIKAGSGGAGLLSGFAQAAQAGVQGREGALGEIPEIMRLREQQDVSRARKARGAQYSRLLGGYDPEAGITYETGRQGVPGQGENSPLLAGVTPPQRSALLSVPPEKGFNLLAGRAFETPPERFETVQNPFGLGGVGQESSTTGKIANFQRPEKAPKPTAQQAKIDEIMNTFGVDRQTAAGIATGAFRVTSDPVTGQPFVVDLARGTSRALRPLPPGQQTDQPPAQQAQATQPGALYGLADETAGVISGAKSVWSGISGQFSDEFVAGETVQARQSITAAQNDLIRALSINPRFPVGEINRLREEINIAPSIWDSPGSLRNRMTAIDRYLRNKLPNEIKAMNDPTLPVETRQAAAQMAKDIGNFLQLLGVPQSQQPQSTGSPGAPAVGTQEDGYRFKGGDPSDQNSWELVQ